MEELTVLIIGAGPSGVATSSCLNSKGVPNTVLEKEDCTASLWRNRSYDRLSLHLAKSYCTLPHKSHALETPTFMSKSHFIDYIDDYVAELNIEPLYGRCVESVFFDKASKKWLVLAKNSVSGALERYAARFLVVATGENSEPFTPVLDGIETFKGQTVHSSQYKSGKTYEGKSVLVIGSGNSGMEISNDLSDFNARTCIVVRSDFHVLTKRMVQVGMLMAKWLPIRLVDIFISKVARFHYGDLSRYGIRVPTVHGPFVFKKLTGKTPVIDTGSIEKIKDNKIKVVPEVERVNGDYIRFKDGTEQKFDAIVFATGYKSSANKWLKDYKYVLDGEGMPKNKFPNHWKGENGIYCAGLSGNGLLGISSDAVAIAEDIHRILKLQKKSS